MECIFYRSDNWTARDAVALVGQILKDSQTWTGVEVLELSAFLHQCLEYILVFN